MTARPNDAAVRRRRRAPVDGETARTPASGSSRRPPSSRPTDERARLAARLDLLAHREDIRGHWRLPLLLALILLVSGATRFEESRSALAEVVVLVAPVVMMVAAVAPLREALPRLRNTAYATAAAIAVLAESALVPVALGRGEAPSLPLLVALLVLAAAMVPIEAVAVRRGFAMRPAALAGMVTALALFLPTHLGGRDPFGALVAGVIVAVVVGGGAGFAAGIAGRIAVGARA